MSSRMDDPVFTMLAAIAAALAVSLASRGLRWAFRVVRSGFGVVRRAKRMITQVASLRSVTLEISLSLRIQPGDQVVLTAAARGAVPELEGVLPPREDATASSRAARTAPR